MQTLRKLFLLKYLKEWFSISIAGVIFLIIGLIFEKSIPGFIGFGGLLFIIFGPIIHASFTNNEYQENLDWLINFQFNRKQLLKFYFFAQSLKLFLVTATYISYIVILALITYKGKTGTTSAKKSELTLLSDIQDIIASPSQLSVLFFVFLMAAYAIYFASLFKANAEHIRRMEIKRSTQELRANFIKSLKNFDFQGMNSYHKASLLSITGLLLFLFAGDNINTFIVIVFLSGAIGYNGVVIFNRKFKILTLNKERVFAYALAVSFILPHFGFYLGAIAEVNNNKAEVKSRSFALDYIRPYYTPSLKVFEQIVSKTTECRDLQELGRYAGLKKFEPKYFITQNYKYCGYLSLIGGYNQHSDFTFLPQLVTLTQEYINKNDLSDDQVLKLALALKHQRAPQRYINTLISQEGIFKKYLAVRLAKRSLDYRKYKIFMKANVDQLPETLKKLGSVKRAIANIHDDELEKKNKDNKHFINYGNY